MKRICSLAAFLLAAYGGGAKAETITLRDCLVRAASANYALKAAAYDESIASEGVNVARSAYMPRVDLQGGYTAQLEPQSVIIADRAAQTQETNYGFFNFAVTQTLYDFGRRSARNRTALTRMEAANLYYTARRNDLSLQVIEAYYGILAAKKFLQTAEDEETQNTDHLRIATNLYEQGVATRNDLLQAEVQLSNSKQRRLLAANNLENRWLYLNYLAAQPPALRGELEEMDENPLHAEDGLQKAFAQRAELKAMNKVIEGSEYEASEVKSGYYPEIFAKAGLDYVQNNRVQEQAIMSATVGLKLNLFEGFATNSRYRQALQALYQNRERLENLKSQVGLEYQTALNDAKVALERIKTTELAIKQGEENLRINKDRYAEQVGTATNVLDAQTLLTQTKTEYYRARYDYQVAAARVKKAMGEL